MATTQTELERTTPLLGVAFDGPRRRVAVVTGTRAEFGLLRSVMKSVRDHPQLELCVVAAGAHLLPRAGGEPTVREVEAAFKVDAVVPMQEAGLVGRAADARALGRGIIGFANAFEALSPDWVVVLGDRIEAFAAASAASVGGWALAHIHGGDRAEGVADEAMRHAITKLAHLHFAATRDSGERIVRMGERPDYVHIVGSPAVDELAAIPPLDVRRAGELGDPDVLVLMHPVGAPEAEEEETMRAVLEGARSDPTRRMLALEPNHDAGREGILIALGEFRARGGRVLSHLPREEFVGLLRRVQVLVGNSSAGMIEAAVIGCPVVNVGRRQAGRLTPMNVVTVEEPTAERVEKAIRQAAPLRGEHRPSWTHPFGTGNSGVRIATALAGVDPHDPGLLRKLNVY